MGTGHMMFPKSGQMVLPPWWSSNSGGKWHFCSGKFEIIISAFFFQINFWLILEVLRAVLGGKFLILGPDNQLGGFCGRRNKRRTHKGPKISILMHFERPILQAMIITFPWHSYRFFGWRDFGVSLWAEFPVSLYWFTPELLYSSTHHSSKRIVELRTGWAQDVWLQWLYENWWKTRTCLTFFRDLVIITYSTKGLFT